MAARGQQLSYGSLYGPAGINEGNIHVNSSIRLLKKRQQPLNRD